MFICYGLQLKAQNADNQGNLSSNDLIIYSNAQEDLAIILFILLYHQVSSLDYYYSSSESSSISCSSSQLQTQNKFDISSNLKEHLILPFSTSNSNTINSSSSEIHKQQPEIKQLEIQQVKVYEINYKLNALLKQKLENFNQEKSLGLSDMTSSRSNSSLDARLRQILDRKFRLSWNFKWHGGSLLKLCNDLFFNEQLVQNQTNSK